MNKSGFVIVDKGLHAVGLNDPNGQEVLPCIYDKILDYDDDGYVRFIKDGVYGTIDLSGNVVIPLSVGITHLGVFHNGTARAQKNNDKWGLVDEHGNEVGEFRYRQINAHHGKGYRAFLMDDTVGFLAEDGTFTSYKRKEKAKPRFSSIATYRQDVAPAYLWKGGWVFIDREQKRINDIEYWSMDPVLRHGIYSVAKGPNQYGAARYDGTPIIDEWFAHPLKFDDYGFSTCDQLTRDEHGNEVGENDGPSHYKYGILKSDGTFLFPVVYSSVHWNNYKTRDCWFAEDDKACFLLFQDGSRRIYRKNSAIRGGGMPYIPLEEYDNNIPEEIYLGIYYPKEICTKDYYRFDEWGFCRSLGRSRWHGVQYDRKLSVFDYTPVSFFYRDTDAIIDHDFYQVGRVLRAGYFMESTDKLLRPVHKTRFVIATSLKLSKVEFLWQQVRSDNLPYRGNVIHCNACFIVVDLYKCYGVTQILLFQIPYAALVLATKNRFDFTAYAGSQYFDSLKHAARRDLEASMNLTVHGYSLSDYWVKAMHHPIGMNQNMKPVHLKIQHNYKYLTSSQDEQLFYHLYDRILHEGDLGWKSTSLLHYSLQRSVIKVVVGDISKLFVDAIVSTADTSLLGRRVGKSKMTEAGNMPCLKIIYTISPTWQGGARREAKTLKSCYTTAMKLAGREKLHSMAFPGRITGEDYPPREAAQIAVDTILENLKVKRFDGDVVICCSSDEEAQVYQDLIKKTKPRYILFTCIRERTR